jgi:integrase
MYSVKDEKEQYLAEQLEEYLKDEKLDPSTKYEYIRISLNFSRFAQIPENITKPEERDLYVKQKVKEFLDIPNPNHFRNTLFALKKLFGLMMCPEYLEGFKVKKGIPKFTLTVPTLEEVKTFGKAIDNDKVRLFFYFSIVSGMRPEHILCLTKNLIDTKNRMINTWMQEFSNKNFFFSFYTPELKPLLEKHLDTLGANDKVFDIGTRYIQKYYVETSKKCGVKIVPKTARKFLTNYLKRNSDSRMIQEDVNLITSHSPSDIVSKHYLENDTMRIKEEYDKATINLKF